MNSVLILEYAFSRDDDDDFGWLAAIVRTPSFSGRNGMWVQWQDVDDLADALATYPIRADRPVAAEWGIGEPGQSVAITTTITSVSIAPEGRTGGLLADVSLADYHEPSNRCSTRFGTDYPSIERFGHEIRCMMRDRTGCATLHGSADVR